MVILLSTICETRCETDELVESDCPIDNPVGPELLRNTRLDGVLTLAKLHHPSTPYDLGIVMLQVKAVVVSGGYSAFPPDWKWRLGTGLNDTASTWNGCGCSSHGQTTD